MFLSGGDVYVSNTRIVLNGTTYATANVTSVAMRTTPPSQGCALLLILAGAIALFAAIGAFAGDGDGWGVLILAAILFGIGVPAYRAARATHHVILASSSGERTGFTSKDHALVQRIVTATADAITWRG